MRQIDRVISSIKMEPTTVLERLHPAPLARSMFSSGLRWTLAAVLMAVALPVVLAEIGAVQFGYWALLTTPTSLSALLDLGVIPSVVSLAGRRLSRARSCGEDEETRRLVAESGSIITAGLIQSVLMGIVAGIVGLAVADYAVHAAKLPAILQTSGVFLFRASVFNLAMTIIGNGLVAATEAVGRVDLASWGAGFLSMTNSALIIAAVSINPSLVGLAWVVAANGVFTVACYWVCALIAGVPLLVHSTGLSRGAVRRVLRVGLGMGAAGAVGSVVDPLVKWATLIVAGPIAVSAFEVAQRIVGMSGGAIRSLLYPLMTHFATVAGRDGEGGLQTAVETSTSRTASLVLPLFGALAAAIGAIYGLWLGQAAPPGVTVATGILLVTSAVSIIATPAYHALQSIASTRSLLAVQITGAVVALSLTLVLGISGGGSFAAAMGYGSGAAVGGILTFTLFVRSSPEVLRFRRLRSSLIQSVSGLLVMIMLGVGLSRLHISPWIWLFATVAGLSMVIAALPESRLSLQFIYDSSVRRRDLR